VRQEGDQVVLMDLGSKRGTYLAGELVQEAVLRDGDVIQLGSDGPKLRFRHEGERRGSLGAEAEQVAPETPAGAPASPAPPRGTPALRAALLALIVAGLAGIVWSLAETRRLERTIARLGAVLQGAQAERRAFEARIEAERRKGEEQRRALETRIDDYRAREDALSQELAAAASGETQALRLELKAARERLATLEAEREVGERIIREYGAGVCLIQGAYVFYDGGLRPLRVRLDSEGEPIRTANGAPELATDASGPIQRADYFGTGFLVAASGLVLSNRHVAEPWAADAGAASLIAAGFTPRFVMFRAFFPKQAEPFELETLGSSEGADLSLVKIDPRGRRIPVVPLDATRRGAVAGQPVVVVGYPTGLEAILAKADSSVVKSILETSGTSSERVTEALARRGLIRPSTTQGHIGDITKTDIVFDAPTTQGGSGGPVFNRSGQVIAIEYAVLSKFGGNAFGVPVRYALDLLRARGRQGASARIGAQ
jgi:S1-C subfamily serine protease